MTYVSDDEQGRGESFSSFMQTQQRPLLRFAAALAGDGRLAEELVAAVLTRVFERWDRIELMERADAYVRRMVVNEFISHKRRERRTAPVAHLDTYTEPTPDHAARVAEREALKTQMASLPARQRAALVLRYYEGLPDPEIAVVLGCAAGTVRSLISRALSTMRVIQDGSPPPSQSSSTHALLAQQEGN